MRTNTDVARAARRPAFTLLEVMIVLVIIGVLGSIVAFNLVGAADRAKADATKTSLKTIAGAMDLYKTTYNEYPRDMRSLLNHNMVTTNTDGWDREIDIMVPSPDGFSYEVRSAGSDGAYDTPDDVVQYPEHEIERTTSDG